MAGGVFCGYNHASATREMTITGPFHNLAALLLVGLAGCAAPEPTRPAYRPREVAEVERWQVRAHGQALGALVKFEIRDPAGPVPFYRVLDGSGRWLGHADARGRFSRRVPFQEGEEDLGVWSLARGCALLFGRDGEVELSRVPPRAVEAGFRPDR